MEEVVFAILTRRAQAISHGLGGKVENELPPLLAPGATNPDALDAHFDRRYPCTPVD